MWSLMERKELTKYEKEVFYSCVYCFSFKSLFSELCINYVESFLNKAMYAINEFANA